MSADIPSRVHVAIEEKVSCVLDQDQGLERLEVKGDLKLMIADPSNARLAMKLADTDNQGFQFRVRAFVALLL